MKLKPTVLLWLLGCMLLGCQPKWSIDVFDVEKMALQEVLDREKWTSGEAKLIEVTSDGFAKLEVSKLPKTPGSSRYITIQRGKVVKYLHGL